MEMGEVEVEIEPFGGSAHLGVLVEGTERPALQAAGELPRPRALLRDDVDDAADRIGTVKPALGAAHHFDTLDVPSQDMLEIKGSGGRIGRVDAVDKDLGLVRVCAADKDGGGSSRPAGLNDIEARNVFEGIGQRPLLLALNFLLGDHRDTAAHLALRRRQAGRRDDHGGQRDGFRQRVAVGRAYRVCAMR
jgi:hypothetical protein